jgi:colanic acid biosynthesis glycosyl transferase WcaI
MRNRRGRYLVEEYGGLGGAVVRRLGGNGTELASDQHQAREDCEKMSKVSIRRMRILVYSMNFAPEPTGIGKFSGEMCAWLAERGHRVRVIAAPPYYPNWRVEAKYRWPPYRRERWQGVEVRRAPLWVPKSPGGVARVAHLLSFVVSSLPLVVSQSFWRPQVVISIAPSFLCAPAGLLTARLCGAQSWLHLQDFEIDLAFKTGLLKGSYLKRMVLRIEAWFLRRFDSVSSISKRMVEHLLQKGVDPTKTRYFPNWVDISHIKPTRSGEQYRTQLGIDRDATVVLYSGSLAAKQGLAVIPEAAALLAKRGEIVFVICGDGVMKPQLQAATEGMTNLRFLPLQPIEQLGELLCMADMHVLPQSREVVDFVLPSKLSGMLASGRPVIATCAPGTELNEVVSACGLVVPPQDAEALAAAIVTLADDPEFKLELGRRARAYAEVNYSREAILGRVFGPLEGDAPDAIENAAA